MAPPGPAGAAKALPQTHSCNKGPTSKGRGRDWRGKGKGKGGRGGETCSKLLGGIDAPGTEKSCNLMHRGVN